MKPDQSQAEQTQLERLSRSRALLHDRYQVEKLLGRGGFGITFLAQDLKLPGNPTCVIKQLCPKLGDDRTLQRARQRFEREAKTLAHLGSHSQIPQLLDYFEIDGEFYLVQEFVPGQTIAQLVQRSGAWSEAAVKAFLREFLPILRFVHQQGVIHRDLKPSNILRCDDGRFVLIDFGAVKEQITAIESDRALTHFIGTVGFAPPEQTAMRPVFSSDLYALGITCLYLLTAKLPSEHDYDRHTGELNWRGLVQVNQYFGQILDRMLKLSIRERFRSADEALRVLELEAYLATLRPCLSNQPLAAQPEAASQSEFIPAWERTAIAIRQWQARLAERSLKDSEK